MSDRDPGLIAAAEAVASWARSRRATWTSTPLDVVATATAVPTPEAAVEVTPHAPSPVPVSPEPSRTDPPVAVYLSDSVRSLGAQVAPWVVRGAIAAALGMAAFVGVPYLLNALPTVTKRKPVVEPTAARPPAVARNATGSLRVRSTPPGARVLVDRKARGVTPLTLADLSPGRHDVVLESSAGTVHRSVTVAAGEAAEMDESIFSGWLTVYAPFEVVIIEGGRTLRTDERNQIMLPPGTHKLRVANRMLAYEAVRTVVVNPGETTTLRVTPEPSTLTVTASEPAAVWLDGAHVGATPLNAMPVPIGTHEIVVTRETGGERRFRVTVGVNAFTLNVDFQ